MIKLLLFIILLFLIFADIFINIYAAEIYAYLGIRFKRPVMYEESLCKYVSIRGIAGLCDKKPDCDILSDRKNFDIKDYANLSDYDTVFVTKYDLKRFLKEVFFVQNKKIILVTGCSDKSAPIEICNLQNIDIESILNSPNLVHWFTTNCDMVHEKISCIPLGLDYHTLYRNNHRWGTQKSPLEQESELISYIPTDDELKNKSNKMYSNFHFTMDRFNDRRTCLNVIKKTPWMKNKVIFEKGQIPRKKVWNKHKSFAFELSPLGVGMDCHRTWEALILKTVPIIRRSTIHDMFDDLPVIQVNDWNELTPEQLDMYYERFHEIIQKNEHKLELNYWKDIILSKKHYSSI